ncbi:MAG: hydrogenase 4 subunit F [Candidatus Saganbacteria bacterium]|nr:hydrogenase 4 subunit F [Candidatus Saganbacteria bacterium]
MQLLIILLLLIPLILALLSFLSKEIKPLALLTSLGYFLNLILSLNLAYQYLVNNTPITLLNNSIYADALSVFFILTISIVVFATALYSQSYIAHDLDQKTITDKKANLFYVLFNLFVLSMLLVTLVNNLGLMWVAIEMTTLVSTFLVGFYNTKNSVEAAWKYIIICSVGITLALLGTILFSYALLFATNTKSLNWTDMLSVASKLDPNLVKIAFIFIMVGYGTKAGLAPMHTWLPDAHSQAVSPISALLSGVLLKTSIYAILRYTMIANKCLAPSYTSNIFILFGLLSLAISAGFILIQKDIKRLLAYHSIEHVGIIIFGFGIGGPLGIFGALFHMFNHAVTKSLLFFGAGNITNTYKTHNMHNMRGVIRALPFTGIMVLMGTFALAGLPPFSIFFSEMMILISAFTQGYYLYSILFLLFVTIIFGAIIHHFSKILFGEKPKNIPVTKDPLPVQLAFVFLFIFMLVMGFFILEPINTLIVSATAILRGI